MQAIILAAGMGKRLGELTRENTKCMVKVGGVSLIERALKILDKKGLSRIIIVVGYQRENLMSFVKTLDIHTPIQFIINDVYDKTNNIFSLSMAKDYLVSEDTLLLESDLIFEECLIDLLLNDERDTLALVDKFESWMDGSCIVVDEMDNMTDFIPGKLLKFSDKERYYKTVNIYKFGAEFSSQVYVPFLEAYAKAMGDNEYYETVINLILRLNRRTIKAERLNGQLWYEIDDIQDLDNAETLFMEDDVARYRKMKKCKGGYWRFPHLLDYSNPVNAYFPNERMIDEITSNLGVLMRQYPSGKKANNLLAEKSFEIRQENVMIGSGATELLGSLLKKTDGKVGFIGTAWEESLTCCKKEWVQYNPAEEDFRPDIEKWMHFFADKEVGSIVLSNPDNLTGQGIKITDVEKILDWCRKRNIRLIVDESLMDFADKETMSVLHQEMLMKNPELYVIKSLSKSYGVPGLQIGILAGGNQAVIDALKDEKTAWNINAVAEFFLQILDKYKADYARALIQVKEARENLYERLCAIPELKVYASCANYFMCELKNGEKSEMLAGKLLKKNILIRDLTGAIQNGKQYIQITVRNEQENRRLINALKECGSCRNVDA